MRRARFVGRWEELALFRAAVTAPDPPFAVLFVHGRGGVGKTALLHAFRDVAEGAGVRAELLDGSEIDPTPSGFQRAWRPRGGPGRSVLLVDAYEALAGIDHWLRRSLLPSLRADTIVVIAGRRPPELAWRAHPGWADLLAVRPLRNLSAADARDYLRGVGVAPDLHDEVVAITDGHPMSLSLVVGVLALDGGIDLSSFHRPDVVHRLLEQFVDAVPSPEHRLALDTLALARAVTRRHLQATVGRDDVDDLYDWLRRLPFVAEGPDGLVPHDLGRHVLGADLRRRDPGRHRSLLRSLPAATGDDRPDSTVGHPAHRALVDRIFAPHARLSRYWDHRRLAEPRPRPVEPGDHEEVVALVAADAGETEARLTRCWLAAQPDAFRVGHDAAGAIESVVGWLDLTRARPGEVAADPVTRAAWDFARRSDPPAPGEAITIARFVAPARDEARRRTTLALGSFEWLRRAVGRADRTWDFLAVTDPDWWRPLLATADYIEVPGGPIEVGDGRRSLFAHDWRRWPELLSLVLHERDWRHVPLPATARPPVRRSRSEVDAAVRQALRALNQPASLARSPLAGPPLVDAGDGDGLAEVLREAVATLTLHPRDEKLHRALDRTYLRPAPTQELAAELLGLPSSTYRRHLSRAVTRVADEVWSRLTG